MTEPVAGGRGLTVYRGGRDRDQPSILQSVEHESLGRLMCRSALRSTGGCLDLFATLLRLPWRLGLEYSAGLGQYFVIRASASYTSIEAGVNVSNAYG